METEQYKIIHTHFKKLNNLPFINGSSVTFLCFVACGSAHIITSLGKTRQTNERLLKLQVKSVFAYCTNEKHKRERYCTNEKHKRERHF